MRSFLRVMRHGLPALVLVVGFLGPLARGDESSEKGPVKDPDALSASKASSKHVDKTKARRESLRDRLTRRFRRVKASPGEQRQPIKEPGGDALSTAAPEPDPESNTLATDLTVPRAERGDTGVQPTVAGQIEKQVGQYAAPAAPTPLILDRALGLEDAPFRLYGWIENSFTGNANGLPRNLSNFSVFPNRLADQWQGNQYYLVVENPSNPTTW